MKKSSLSLFIINIVQDSDSEYVWSFKESYFFPLYSLKIFRRESSLPTEYLLAVFLVVLMPKQSSTFVLPS